MPVHFYSPLPDIGEIERRGAWGKVSEMAGIEFSPERQLALMHELAGRFGDECEWPDGPNGDVSQFYTENGCFSFGCAALTHCMIRHKRPQRVIEIGSGNSSLIISQALAKNKQEDGATPEHFVIDPYPREEIKNWLDGKATLIEECVELMPPSLFDGLQANDILFIDSSHVVRIGGDVNFLYLDVLPRLGPGVTIHSHDISLPFEYSKEYYTNPKFRVFWTEAYLLQALLSHSTKFEVLLGMDFIMRTHPSEFQAAFRHHDPSKHKLTSVSFWFCTKTNNAE